jgi:hypothetical protein
MPVPTSVRGAWLARYLIFLADCSVKVMRIGEVGSIASALLSLFSSIVGGVLVLAGQYFARRAEDRRHWLLRLHEAAADLATSYLQEAALVNDSRRSGKAAKDVATTTYVVDRQKALGRFRTLPWASVFERERQSMGAAIDKVWLAWDDPDDEFQRAYKDVRSAVAAFMSSVGQHLLGQRGRRPKALKRTA